MNTKDTILGTIKDSRDYVLSEAGLNNRGKPLTSHQKWYKKHNESKPKDPTPKKI